MRNKRKGVSLIEALFVLGIMAILLGIVMVLFSQSNDKAEAVNAYIEIADIKDAMSSIMTTPGAYDDFNTQILTRSGLLPNKYISSDYNSLVTPFHTSATVVGNGGMTYAIYFWGLSKTQCVNMLSTYNPGDFSFVQVSQLIQYHDTISGTEIARICNYNAENIELIYVVDQDHMY